MHVIKTSGETKKKKDQSIRTRLILTGTYIEYRTHYICASTIFTTIQVAGLHTNPGAQNPSSL